MQLNSLQLNKDKTEIIVFSNKVISQLDSKLKRQTKQVRNLRPELQQPLQGNN